VEFSTKPQSIELSELVRSIWCYQSQSAHEFERIQPGVNGQLLINLHENELRHWADPQNILRTTGPVAAQGVLTSPLLIDTIQKRNVCGVAFTSFGLSSFCELPASRFTDSIVDATTFWGQTATGLRNVLINEDDPAKCCQIIEDFLIARLILRKDENELLKEILRMIRAGVTLHSIREKTGLSQRALHAIFERRIGVRPKTYSRIDRFSATLEPLTMKVSLYEIAIDNGFSDQAHFTREFRTFAGNTPTHHLPIANESQHAQVIADKLFKTPDRN